MSDELHFSLDEIGVSVLAPVGFMNDALGDDSVILWDDPEDDRPDSATTFEFRRLLVKGSAARELCVQRLGRVSQWMDELNVVADGIVCEGQTFVSDGDGGPMQGFVAIVPLEIPVALRAEWKTDDDRLNEMLAIASSTRFLLPRDIHLTKNSLTHIDFRMSVDVPEGWTRTVSDDHMEMSGPGSRWVLKRATQPAISGTSELLFDDISLTAHLGVGKLLAQVQHPSDEFSITAEGDDLSTLMEITRSLRFHQFIDQLSLD
jgi:hypothetical protein